MQKLIIKLSIIASLLFGLGTLSPVLVSALDPCANPQTAQDQIQCGANSASGNSGTANPSTTISDTIATVINLLSLAVGVIAVIMIIIGGFRYITSGGKQDSITGAKNTILYAIIGLVIVALAQVIVHFVLNNTQQATTGQTNNAAGVSPGAANSPH